MLRPHTAASIRVDRLVGSGDDTAATLVPPAISGGVWNALFSHDDCFDPVGSDSRYLSAAGSSIIAIPVLVVTIGHDLLVARGLELAVCTGSCVGVLGAEEWQREESGENE